MKFVWLFASICEIGKCIPEFVCLFTLKLSSQKLWWVSGLVCSGHLHPSPDRDPVPPPFCIIFCTVGHWEEVSGSSNLSLASPQLLLWVFRSESADGGSASVSPSFLPFKVKQTKQTKLNKTWKYQLLGIQFFFLSPFEMINVWRRYEMTSDFLAVHYQIALMLKGKDWPGRNLWSVVKRSWQSFQIPGW